MTSQTATSIAKLEDLDKATGVPKPEFHNSEYLPPVLAHRLQSPGSSGNLWLSQSSLALCKSHYLGRIGYSAWATRCTAPKRARGPCNLICKVKMVEYHFWNGTLFDEQVNGGTMDTRNTTLSPAPQGSPIASRLASSSFLQL